MSICYAMPHVLQVQDIDDVIVVALEDRNTDNPGRIKLFLAKNRAWSSRNGSQLIPRAWILA